MIAALLLAAAAPAQAKPPPAGLPVRMKPAASAALPSAAPPAPPAVQNRPAEPAQAQVRAPFGFMTAGKLSESCIEQSSFSVSYCYAYLAGIHDAIRAYEVWLGQPEFCPPEDVAQNDLRDAFVAYVAAHRDVRPAQGASVAVVALKSAYPCPASAPAPAPAPGGAARPAKP